MIINPCTLCKSHYQRLHKKNVSFGVITHFVAATYKRPLSYWKTLKCILYMKYNKLWLSSVHKECLWKTNFGWNLRHLKASKKNCIIHLEQSRPNKWLLHILILVHVFESLHFAEFTNSVLLMVNGTCTYCM